MALVKIVNYPSGEAGVRLFDADKAVTAENETQDAQELLRELGSRTQDSLGEIGMPAHEYVLLCKKEKHRTPKKCTCCNLRNGDEGYAKHRSIGGFLYCEASGMTFEAWKNEVLPKLQEKRRDSTKTSEEDNQWAMCRKFGLERPQRVEGQRCIACGQSSRANVTLHVRYDERIGW